MEARKPELKFNFANMNNLPEKFEQFMKKKLGDQFPEFVSSLHTPSPTSIRLNPKKKPAIIPDKPVLWSKYGKYLNERPIFTLDPHFHAGTYYVQEASSMFLEQAFNQVVDLKESLNVLDLSASPGGKSSHILSLINSRSLLVSNDVIRSRASILAENLQKWGHANVVVTNNDPKDFQSLPGFFDVLVIDAPCSGEGLFRKDSEAINEWSPENVALCSSRQKRIIADVWPALKENGILIYSTCTYNEAENEENLLWLQKDHAIEFLKLDIDKAWGIEETVKGNAIGYRFFPHRVNGEGFFISIMRKLKGDDTFKLKPRKRLIPASKKSTQMIQSWIIDPESYYFFQHNEVIYALPVIKTETVDVLAQHLKIINAGTAITAIKHEKAIPEHALAMSIDLHQENFISLAVDYAEAIRYLRRDMLTLPETSKGYCLITFENIPLGWVNSLGNRFNNMYPSEWRIRMSPK